VYVKRLCQVYFGLFKDIKRVLLSTYDINVFTQYMRIHEALMSRQSPAKKQYIYICIYIYIYMYIAL